MDLRFAIEVFTRLRHGFPYRSTEAPHAKQGKRHTINNIIIKLTPCHPTCGRRYQLREKHTLERNLNHGGTSNARNNYLFQNKLGYSILHGSLVFYALPRDSY